jgi:hypothetical protein
MTKNANRLLVYGLGKKKKSSTLFTHTWNLQMQSENLSFGKVTASRVEGAPDCVSIVFEIRSSGNVVIEVPIVSNHSRKEFARFVRHHIKDDYPERHLRLLCNDVDQVDEYTMNITIASREDKKGYDCEIEDDCLYFRFHALKTDLEKLEKILQAA